MHPSPKAAPRKGTLGSAMISSVTSILSPVLPFAGGMDLRRDDNWKRFSNWKWIVGQALVKSPYLKEEEAKPDDVNPMFQIPRGGSQSRRHIQHLGSMTLSASDPFLSLDEISKMTLKEVAYLFRYAMESGKKHFDFDHFTQKDFENEPVNHRMINAITAIKKAVEASRGKNIAPLETNLKYSYDNHLDHDTSFGTKYGEIDALHFCGAMRILAEWRVLRQVPPGYKGKFLKQCVGEKVALE